MHHNSRFDTCYPKFNKNSFFINLAKSVRKALEVRLTRHGRKWYLDDILVILCYSWIRGVSIHHACVKLYPWAQKYLIFKPQKYIDGRFSRTFPNQTTVNDWLRTQILLNVENVYRIVFEKMIRFVFF
ncbi:hypothetical protein [Candidatus Harpocratesius sp.]